MLCEFESRPGHLPMEKQHSFQLGRRLENAKKSIIKLWKNQETQEGRLPVTM